LQSEKTLGKIGFAFSVLKIENRERKIESPNLTWLSWFGIGRQNNESQAEAMSEITSITIQGRYLDRWEDLITTAEAAKLANTSPQAVGQRIVTNKLATAWLPGTKSSAIKLLVRREWEELLNKESK